MKKATKKATETYQDDSKRSLAIGYSDLVHGFGGISLNNLPTGKSRYINKEEYKNLRIFMNEDD